MGNGNVPYIGTSRNGSWRYGHVAAHDATAYDDAAVANDAVTNVSTEYDAATHVIANGVAAYATGHDAVVSIISRNVTANAATDVATDAATDVATDVATNAAASLPIT